MLFYENRSVETKSIKLPKNALHLPDLRQENNYSCGLKVVESIVAYYRIDDEVSIKKLKKDLETCSENGTRVAKILEFFKSVKLKTLAREFKIEDLEKFLDSGFPIIIPLQAYADNFNSDDYAKTMDHGHYVIAIGYDEENIFFEDPSSYNRVYLPKKDFLKRWHDKDNDEEVYHNFGIVIKQKSDFERDYAVFME
jgi:ABC-type bacteriocin/lantibiotic exporter with double-glycine peptidase domain